MDKELQELESILKSELELHDALCETARLFNDAIRSNDLALMQKHILEQDEKICKIEHLEESRITCCSELSKNIVSPAKDAKMSAIIDAISPDWKKRLSPLQSSLKSVINKLSKINTSNRILLEEANTIINKTFDMIRHSQDHLQSYSAQGKIPARRSGCALYNNVV
jgi:flagellar biosynthesis/type III secretory pathway chaperone